MSKKKDRLVNSVAQLLTQYGKEDWLYLAHHLEDAAKIARDLADADIASNLGTARTKTKQKPKANQSKSMRERSYSPSVMDFRKTLEDLKPQPSNEILRKIAIEIGIKSETPKTKSGIVEEICKFLESLPESARPEKIHLALHLSQKVNDQTEDFSRWVNIITKRDH